MLRLFFYIKNALLKNKTKLLTSIFALALLTKLSAVPPTGGSSAPDMQFFRINAQYRASVKKSFTNIGCAFAAFANLPNSQIRSVIYLCAVLPNKKRQNLYFKLDNTYNQAQNSITQTSERISVFDNETARFKNELKSIAALWACLWHIKNPPSEPFWLNCGENTVELRPKMLKNECQITGSLKTDSRFSCKFFYKKHSESDFELVKLRFRYKNVVVSLIKDSQKNIARDFAGKEPFKTYLFGQAN